MTKKYHNLKTYKKTNQGCLCYFFSLKVSYIEGKKTFLA